VITTTDTLVERACAQAGLDDFGAAGWRDGLEHLVDAVARDVGDDAAVVERIEALVVGRLVHRLRIEAWCAEHPAEVARTIEGPLVVVGLPRTATTALHYLLAVDPQFRFLRTWEVSDPVPPPDATTERDDPRRPAAAPPADVRHIATVDGPAEDWPIHALAFDHAELTLPVPSLTTWWRSREHETLLPYHEQVLRLLHSRRPPRRWLLKMPAYLFLLPQTAAHYPGARFVMTHRDPVAAIASTCSTVAAARRKRTPTWSPEPGFGEFLLEHWAEGMRQAMAGREALGEDRFTDVGQRELEADPIGVAERIYDFTGVELASDVRDAMSTWARDNRRGSRGVHRYRPEDFDLSAAGVTDAFAPYLERFGAHCR
jgi:hypothetical protein